MREPLIEKHSQGLSEDEEIQEIILKEEKRDCVVNASKLDNDHLIFRYSSWNRLILTNAWCLRFLDNMRKLPPDRLSGLLSVPELSKVQ